MCQDPDADFHLRTRPRPWPILQPGYDHRTRLDRPEGGSNSGAQRSVAPELRLGRSRHGRVARPERPRYSRTQPDSVVIAYPAPVVAWPPQDRKIAKGLERSRNGSAAWVAFAGIAVPSAPVPVWRTVLRPR